MYENVRSSAPSLASRQHRRGEDRRHPPRRSRAIPSRPVDENHIPVDVVELVGEVVNCEGAVGEEEVLDWAALVPYLFLGGGDQLGHLGDGGGVADVVGLEVGVLGLEPGGEVLVLVEEDGTTIVIDGLPEEGFMAEAEDEKVAGGGAASEGGGDGAEVGGGHVGSGVGGGGVVKEGVDDE